ncbi:MAG: hypothetical protein ACM3KM_03825 [Acidobacteriaceae bacterium]
MKKARMMVGAGLASAIAFSALYSFAAKPNYAGQMPKDERTVLMEQARADKLQAQAQKAIDSAVALNDKLTAKAAELNIEIPASDFQTYLDQANAAFAAGQYKDAKLFANMAKDALEPLDLLIEEAEAALEATTEPVEDPVV